LTAASEFKTIVLWIQGGFIPNAKKSMLLEAEHACRGVAEVHRPVVHGRRVVGFLRRRVQRQVWGDVVEAADWPLDAGPSRADDLDVGAAAVVLHYPGHAAEVVLIDAGD
jgi:hypothetical protein